MIFSIVGNLTSALPLMQQIRADRQHDFGSCCLSGDLAAAIAQDTMALRLESQPENAFLAPDVDIVVLALDDAEQILQLTRSASQSERHVLVIAPPTISTAFGFELHLLLDESSRAIIPLLGRMRFADLPANRLMLHDDVAMTPASAQQIVIEQSIVSDEPALLRSQQLEALDCVGALGLKYTQITAIESRATNGTLISRLLTLGMSAVSEQSLPPTTITIRTHPAAGGAAMSVQIIGLDGTTVAPVVHDIPDLLPRIALLCESRPLCTAAMEAFSTALELSDAVDKSLRRRRTVDVYFDSGSERNVFKSQMTAIGCGVLTWTLLGMIVFLTAAQVLELPPAVLHLGRILWIAPVVLFLAVQLLLPLTRDRQSSK